MKFSIAIPAYEAKGTGVVFLEELLQSILAQTLQDYEVVIADHSKDEKILNLCEKYSKKMRIRYIRNFYNRGNGPANTNVAIAHCTGDYIKIMFSDDLFVSNKALELIAECHDSTGAGWIVTGFNHTSDGKNFYRPMIPRWSEHLLEGQNFMGGPSIVSMRRESAEMFDPKCSMLMDTDFYHRMRMSNKMPVILEDILVSSREGDYRVSANLNMNIVCEHEEGNWEANDKELEYVTTKHENNRTYPDE